MSHHYRKISSVLFVKCLAAAATFLAAMALARYSDAAEFGRYVWFWTASVLVAAPIRTGLSQLLTRQAARHLATDDCHIISGTLKSFGCISVGYGICAIPVFALFSLVIWGLDHFLVIVQASIIAAFLMMLGLISGYHRGIGNANQSQIPDLLFRPTLLLVGVIAYAEFSESVANVSADIGLGIHIAASIGAVLLAIGYSPSRFVGREMSSTSPRTMVDRRSVAFFMVLAFLQFTASRIDVILVGIRLSETETGVYGAAVTIGTLGGFVLAAANTAFARDLASYQAIGEWEEFFQRFRWVAVISGGAGALAVLVFAVLGKTILSWVGQAYTAAYIPALLLLAGQAINGAFGPVALAVNLLGEEQYTVLALVLALLVGGAIAIAFIELWGLIGAAIGGVFIVLIWNSLLAAYLHYFRQNIDREKHVA